MFGDSVLTLAFAAGGGFCGGSGIRSPAATGSSHGAPASRICQGDEVTGDVARLIARSPVNICTRRTDDG